MKGAKGSRWGLVVLAAAAVAEAFSALSLPYWEMQVHAGLMLGAGAVCLLGAVPNGLLLDRRRGWRDAGSGRTDPRCWGGDVVAVRVP